MKKGNSSTTQRHRTGTKKPKPESQAASKNDLTKVPKNVMPRKEAALKRLGISQESLDRTPKISELLKASLGSVDKAIEAMRFSGEKCLVDFLHTYDKIPSGDRDNLPFEAIFLASKVSVNEFLGAIIVSFQSIQAQKSALLAMAGHPEIVEKSIEIAKTPGGVQDRRMMHEALRFLPSAKGTTFNFNLPGTGETQPPAKHTSKNEPEDDDMDVNSIFPVITDRQQGWQERKQKLLKDTN